jgi:hypothetical protein
MCEGRENFKVTVRVRPRLPNEVASGFVQVKSCDMCIVYRSCER